MKPGFLEKLIERLGRIIFCASRKRKVSWKPFSMPFRKASS